MRWWLAWLAILVLVAAASCGGGDKTASWPTLDLSITATPVPLHQTGRGFIGDLGNFKVSWGGFVMPCEDRVELQASDPSTSKETELWNDMFSPQATFLYCASERNPIAILESRDGLLFRRHFFYDLPLVVTFPGGEEPPRLDEIEGPEAIISGSPGEPKGASFYVIEREPIGAQPGVFVGVTALSADFAAVEELAAELLQ